MDARTQKPSRRLCPAGSALILTVVLTSLLAILGVMFVLLSRMDKISALASSQDRQLDLAVRAVIATISDRLVQDTPGVLKDQDGHPLQEYYDYPDAADLWLARLEPEQDGGGRYVWRQVSSLANSSVGKNGHTLAVEVVKDRQPITDPNGPADADGDGVADASWSVLEGVTSSKGRPIYAAVRIVDHGAMLNVNTAWKFDISGPNDLLDGSHQMQIDLSHLSTRGKTPDPAGKLYEWRADTQGWQSYLKDVVWRFDGPPAPYTPFDISDELKLRYRYILNLDKVTSRLDGLWVSAFDGGLKVPVDTGGKELDAWARKVICPVSAAASAPPDPNYDYRHVGTVYSMDRLIDPTGQRMVNVNDANAVLLYGALREAGVSQAAAAQLAVNIKDFVDDDCDSTVLAVADVNYYGLEPQPFIRQIGFKISASDPGIQGNNEFMVELCNPFGIAIDLSKCVLSLVDPKTKGVSADVRLPSSIGPHQSIVLTSKDKDPDRSNLVLALYSPSGGHEISQRHDLYLVRKQGNNSSFYLDRQLTDDRWFDWNTVKGKAQYYARADANWNILYQNMTLVGETPLNKTPAKRADDPTTWDWVSKWATRRNYNLPSPQPLPVSSKKGLATIGDISRLLLIGPRLNDPGSTIGDQLRNEPAENAVRLDLRIAAIADVFQYLTAMAPENFDGSRTETRVKGRINVNTAPAFVIDRLPWLRWIADIEINNRHIDIGQAIVDYRNRYGAFKSIGDLMQVDELGCMQGFAGQEPNGPDLTPDGVLNDLEAMDLLFSRISNLVTVRSDVFSVYILVRIGEEGPQRRVLAILDRSQVKSLDDKVRIIALHTVPDPR